MKKIEQIKTPVCDITNKTKTYIEQLSRPEIATHIDNLNAVYKHWDEIRHQAHPLRPEEVWCLMKFVRAPQYRKLEYGGFGFKYCITDAFQRQLHEMDMGAGWNLGTDELAPPSEMRTQALINSLMEEAIASAQLEGADTERKVAKEILRSGSAPRNESERMIINSYRTMQMLKEIKHESLTPELLLRLQRSITEGTLPPEQVGHYRTSDDIAVMERMTHETIYTPPPYTKIDQFVHDLCEFANQDSEPFIHPVLKAVILHFMIGYLHPFENGNGRTARTLFYWYVLKKGYWLFEYMPISRAIKKAPAQYYMAYLYTESDDNDLTYFMRFHLDKVAIALKDLHQYMGRKRLELEGLRHLVEQERKDRRLNLRQSEIAMHLAKHPMRLISIKEIENTFGIVYQTARTDLELLTHLGYCKQFKEGKRFLYRKAEGLPAPRKSSVG